MRFGVNMLLFSDKPDKTTLNAFPRLKEMGFDGIELPIFAPKSTDSDKIRKLAEKYELKLTMTGCPPPGSRFYGKAGAPRVAAERYMRAMLKLAVELDAKVVAGPLFKTVGDMDESLPFSAQRRETAKAFRPIAAEAEEKGIMIAFEPLNRFETNFMNLTEDSIAFAKAIESPASQLLLDTFHMHIEEKNTPAALRAAHKAGVLGHVHFSENDRGTVGTGQICWAAAAETLSDLGYDGWIMLESFCQDNQAIKRAVSCWRPFFDNPYNFCAQGIKYAKGLFRN